MFNWGQSRGTSLKENICFEAEELRTICGCPTPAMFQRETHCEPDFNYWAGDDLSEDLFLLFFNGTIRFGHVKMPFVCDGAIVDTLVRMLYAYADVYGKFQLNVNFEVPGSCRHTVGRYLPGVGETKIYCRDCEKRINKTWDRIL